MNTQTKETPSEIAEPASLKEVRQKLGKTQAQIAEETGNNLKVFYLDGKNENPWSLETTESGLKISFENQVRESPNLKELQWKLWEKDNRIIGLEVTIPRGGKIYTLHWPWGAQPL